MARAPGKLLEAYNISQADIDSKKKLLQSNFEKISDSKNTLHLIKKVFNEMRMGLQSFKEKVRDDLEDIREITRIGQEAFKSVNFI